MKVTILFKDKTRKTFTGIRQVNNASTNVPQDWIDIYRIGDLPGQPSIQFPMEKVTCVLVCED